MAKGFAHISFFKGSFNRRFMTGTLFPIAMLAVTVFALSSCAKKEAARDPSAQIPVSEPYAITSSKLQNCHFKNPSPTYSFNASIEPNTILCEEGVPRKVILLSPNALPHGLEFDANLLALAGTPNERVVSAPYDYYLENEAGYVIIKLAVTVK